MYNLKSNYRKEGVLFLPTRHIIIYGYLILRQIQDQHSFPLEVILQGHQVHLIL